MLKMKVQSFNKAVNNKVYLNLFITLLLRSKAAILLHVVELGPVAQSDASLTCNLEVVGSILQYGTILLLRLIMKSFLQSFSPFC